MGKSRSRSRPSMSNRQDPLSQSARPAKPASPASPTSPADPTSTVKPTTPAPAHSPSPAEPTSLAYSSSLDESAPTLSDAALATVREQTILPVLRKLQSARQADRTTAAALIDGIAQDSEYRKLLLRQDILHTLLNDTLTDSSLESRVAGWDILRALVEEEEGDFCVRLYQCGIMTLLSDGAKQLAEILRPHSNGAEAQQLVIRRMAACQLIVLDCVVEVNAEAVDRVSMDPHITPLLLALIPLEGSCGELAEAALTCLLTLSEENEVLARQIVNKRDPGPLNGLRKVIEQADESKAVLACGIIHTVYTTLGHGADRPARAVSDARLTGRLSSALALFDPDPNAALELLSTEDAEVALQILASIGTGLQDVLTGKDQVAGEAREGRGRNDGDEEMGEPEDKKEVKKEVKKAAKKATKKEVKKEVTKEIKKEDEDDGDGKMDKSESDPDLDMLSVGSGHGDENVQTTAGRVPRLLLRICHQAIPQLVRLTCPPKLGQTSDIDLQVLALSALSNIAWSVSHVDFSQGRNAAVQATWTPCGCLIWKKVVTPLLTVATNTADGELATKVTGLAWALARTLRGGRLPHVPGEERKFMHFYHAARLVLAANPPGEPFQTLGVKIIGVLGQIARHPAPAKLNRQIGVFLITRLARLPKTPTAEAIEALDQLFDIYGDENYPYDQEVFWADHFLAHLNAVLPKMELIAKQIDRRAMPELRERADEVVLNLRGFIDYKRSHRRLHP